MNKISVLIIMLVASLNVSAQKMKLYKNGEVIKTYLDYEVDSIAFSAPETYTNAAYNLCTTNSSRGSFVIAKNIETGVFESSLLATDDMPQGTELGKSTNITCTYMPAPPYAGTGVQQVKSVRSENGPSATSDYKITFDGEPLLLTDGIQGYVNGNKTGGWALCFEVGDVNSGSELYVAGKLVGSKKYCVMQESSTGELKYIPYWIISNSYNAGSIQFVTPYDMSVNEYDWSVANAEPSYTPDQFNTNGVDHGHTAPALSGQYGAGVIFFDVQPNCKYYLYATGTKVIASGWALNNGGLVKDIIVEQRDRTTDPYSNVTVGRTYLLKNGTIEEAIAAYGK